MQMGLKFLRRTAFLILRQQRHSGNTFCRQAVQPIRGFYIRGLRGMSLLLNLFCGNAA
jgi:hypothetical protein